MEKRRITALVLGDCIRYTIQQKEHLWNRWNYIFDGKYPRLFSYEELVKFGFIHPALNDRDMKMNNLLSAPMSKEEKIIEVARKCASCYFVKEWKDKLPNAMAELDHLLKEYYKEKK